MGRDKGIGKVHPSNWIFPTMACLTALLTVLVTFCGKKEEKVPERKVVRPVKIMTVMSGGVNQIILAKAAGFTNGSSETAYGQ